MREENILRKNAESAISQCLEKQVKKKQIRSKILILSKDISLTHVNQTKIKTCSQI